jgi:hypothetical protein
VNRSGRLTSSARRMREYSMTTFAVYLHNASCLYERHEVVKAHVVTSPRRIRTRRNQAAEVRRDHAAPLAPRTELLTGQITDPFEQVHALTALARTVCALGDGDRGRRLTSQAKDLAVQSRDPYLMGLAMLEAARYDLSRSAQLVEVEALVTEIPRVAVRRPGSRLAAWSGNGSG